jgi:hypothetical protein
MSSMTIATCEARAELEVVKKTMRMKVVIGK